MKTLVKTLTAATLIVVSIGTAAAGKPEKKVVNLSTASLAIDHYVDVMTEGQSIGLEQLFASDFNQKVQGTNTKTNSRSEVINFLKKQRGEKMNCETIINILEKSTDYMVAKITLKFEDFTKTDIVTLINEDGAWKVSNSVNAYR